MRSEAGGELVVGADVGLEVLGEADAAPAPTTTTANRSRRRSNAWARPPGRTMRMIQQPDAGDEDLVVARTGSRGTGSGRHRRGCHRSRRAADHGHREEQQAGGRGVAALADAPLGDGVQRPGRPAMTPERTKAPRRASTGLMPAADAMRSLYAGGDDDPAGPGPPRLCTRSAPATRMAEDERVEPPLVVEVDDAPQLGALEAVGHALAVERRLGDVLLHDHREGERGGPRGRRR